MTVSLSYYRDNTLRVLDALKHLLKCYGIVLAIFVGLIVAFSSRFTIGVNVTESLPHTLYLIDKANRNVVLGDYVAFSWKSNKNACPLGSANPDCAPNPIPDDATLIKTVRGVAGDRVSIIEQTVFINKKAVSVIKTHAKDGSRLLPVTSGVIGEGQLYVHADHPDSLDSRYLIPGLIDEAQIKGKAYPIF